MTMPATTGAATHGKPINLAQLQGELNTAGVTVDGLGMHDEYVYTYGADGKLTDFASGDQATVDQCIVDHVAMRGKTDAELAAEFQATSDPVVKQDLRDQMSGLLPREQVPM